MTLCLMWQKGRKVNGHILEWFPLSLPATRKQSNLMKETLEQWKSNEIKSCFNLSVEKVVPQLRYYFVFWAGAKGKSPEFRIKRKKCSIFDILDFFLAHTATESVLRVKENIKSMEIQFQDSLNNSSLEFHQEEKTCFISFSIFLFAINQKIK